MPATNRYGRALCRLHLALAILCALPLAADAHDIAGTVFEDANFVGTASNYDGGVSDQALPNVDVELYTSADGYISSTTTAGDGSYSFTGVSDGSYKVRVRSATVGDADTPPAGGFNATVPATWPYPLPEMTWGENAAMLGGKTKTIDDTVTGNNAGPGDTWAGVTVSGANVSGVNLGFAFNLIVNVADDTNADNVQSTQGSLRQFIKNANAIGNAGTTASSSEFNIGGGGLQTIAVQPGGFPFIDDPIVLDATTQPGPAGSPLIQLDGLGATGATAGLALRTDDSTIKGFIVHSFPDEGIEMDGSTGFGDNNIVQFNWVGVDDTGAKKSNLDFGVMITVGATGNQVGGGGANEGNVISGNGNSGLVIRNVGSDDNKVWGNLIGVGPDSITAVPNDTHGIEVVDSAADNVIGGPGSKANLIANNLVDGIYLAGGSTDRNTITGNSIYGNTGLGINLAGDGANDDKTSPTLVSLTLSAGDFIVTASSAAGDTVEFFRVNNASTPTVTPDGSGNGEGYVYLGRCADGGNCDGPHMVGAADADPASGSVRGTLLYAGVTARDYVTATAKEAAKGTSEFSANMITPGHTISGVVFEDADFAGTASAYDSGVDDLALANVDVELYDGADAYVSSTTTAGDGSYSFADLADGTYKVRVRSATLGDADTPPAGGLNASVPATWPYPVAEMTWGNGTALYGGASATADDTDTADNGGPGDTFVNVNVAGASVASVELGFTYNLIVNTADDGRADNLPSDQGSLRQFLKNANAIAGADSSWFRIPNTDPGYNGSGNGEYTVSLLAALSSLNERVTVDGTTQPDYTTRPLIDLDGGALGGSGFNVLVDSCTVRGFIVHGFATGIFLQSNANVISGNYIGTNVLGTAAGAPPNTSDGIYVSALSGNRIEENLISGNARHGVWLSGASGTLMLGNHVGTDAAGGAAVANAHWGIRVQGVATNNTIGNTGTGDANVVSGNTLGGIWIGGVAATGNVIQGNRIGTDLAGTANVGNLGSGILIDAEASNTTVGGATAAAGNTIAFNTGAGVELLDNGGGASDPPWFNTIRSNDIFSNGGAGIDLDGDGVTENDLGDSDDGSNEFQNFPVITSATSNATTTTIMGTLNSKAGEQFHLDFFSSSAVDPSGNGEGEVYLGVDSLTTDGTGNGSFTAVLFVAVTPGDFVTATATDSLGNTSEFSDTLSVASLGDADLQVTKSVDDGTPDEGQSITYTVVLTNNGPDSATNVQVTDLLPAGVTYVSDTPTQGTYNSGTGVWDVVSIANAVSDTLEITATVDTGTGGSTIGNTASVTASDQTDGTPGNDSDSADITVQFTGPLVVDTAADSVDGDTSSLTSLVGDKGADGRISLREAIVATNNTAGPDTIQFAILLADSGHVYYQDDSIADTLSQIVHTTLNDASISDFDPDYPGGAVAGYSWYRIRVEGTPLPTVTDTLFLDGTSQTGFSGNPIVELDGSVLGGVGEDGFNITGGASTVRGFVINQFSGSGIELTTAGGNTVTGNHIGTDVTALVDRGNGVHGIHVFSDTGGSTIGGDTVSARNVISGNVGNGIFLQASSSNTVHGNYIGADKNAAPNLGNDGHGILIEGGDDNAVGGTGPDEGNLISGNLVSGVAVRN